MDPADRYYVGTCTHVGESDEIDACARRRLTWLDGMHGEGLRVEVALCDDAPVGFLYVMPIEVCPWGPLGRDLSVIPCLVVPGEVQGRGAGRAFEVRSLALCGLKLGQGIPRPKASPERNHAH